MATQRDGLLENREAFKEAKSKITLEAEIDKKREQVAVEKEKKVAKRDVRESQRREKE